MTTHPAAPRATPAAGDDFQAFQRALGRHLRDPHHVARPTGVPARRVAVYQDLLFNNLCGFLDACFPVSRAVLGDIRWRRLNRTFYRDWPLHTPWFREIPREFTRYLAEGCIAQRLPAWLAELAHYEWVELAVDTLEVAMPDHDPAASLMHAPIVLNPTLMNLAYQWPVHRIGTDYRPRKPQATDLLVHRDSADQVQFTASNPVTARLLTLLAATPTTGEQAGLQIARELQHPDPARLLAFTQQVLENLRAQNIILGTK